MQRSRRALRLLKEGNARFVEGKTDGNAITTAARRSELTQGQHPSAIILGCSDSRVPAEIIFDQGLGELFVIRVAGNIVAPSLVGSVEYAVEQAGTRLVVVLGHTGCGAVDATVSYIQQPEIEISQNLGEIVERIRPSVRDLMNSGEELDRDALVRATIRANVKSSVEELKRQSEVLQRFIKEDFLIVIGAEYSLETGEVEFFDEYKVTNSVPNATP